LRGPGNCSKLGFKKRFICRSPIIAFHLQTNLQVKNPSYHFFFLNCMGKLTMWFHTVKYHGTNHFCVMSPAEMLHFYFSKTSTNTPSHKGISPPEFYVLFLTISSNTCPTHCSIFHKHILMPPESEYKLQFLILHASVYLLFHFTSKLEIPHLEDVLYRVFFWSK
jgi:hypothetical protein